MSLNVLFCKFSSTSTSFSWSKICPLYLNPFLRGILSQQLKNDFEIFERWLCHKFQILHRLYPTDTGLDVRVIMFTQCYDESNAMRFSYGRSSFTRFWSVRQLINALKLGFNVLLLAPLLGLLLLLKYNIDNFPFVQSKAFVTQVMHADISYWHIVFLLFLFPNL